MKPYGYMIVFLFCIGIKTCGSISNHPLLLVVSFDGFWAGYFDKYSEVLPNLHKLAQLGVRTPWMKNVFITKTFPNHHSIATGVYEENHGIVANEFYDPELNETFKLRDTEAKWWDTGAMPIWVLNQLHDEDRYSGGMMWPGTNAIIHNQTAFHMEEYTKCFEKAKEKVDTIISWFTNDTYPANCVFAYFEEPDSTGHRYGPNSPEMKETLAKVDSVIGYIQEKLQEASLFQRVNLMVLSDHGMSEIAPENVIELDKILNSTFYDKNGTSPVWGIYPKKDFDDYVFNTLKEATATHKLMVYKKEDIPMEFHYRFNNRIPPILLVAEDGYDLTTTIQRNNTNPFGNHGYNNSVDSMHALFVGHGPEFKRGAVMEPFSNLDLYPLMCRILHLTPRPHNGTLANTILMLNDPYGIQITNTWFVVICSVLGFCILTAIIAVAIKQSRWEQMDTYDTGRYLYRSKKSGLGAQTAEEENTYLLVPAATDEV